MPRIIEYTPPWLSRPAAGFQVFSNSSKKPKDNPDLRPRTPPESTVSRLMARHGTQIFIVVDNQLRWADLIYMKDWYDSESNSKSAKPNGSSRTHFPESIFRIVKAPIKEKILNLSVSPQGEFLAVLTSHTVHILNLHDKYDVDIGPMRFKTSQLGPTEHAVDGSSVVCGLWHPLGLAGRCFVTISSDSIVRLWDLNRNNTSSFATPSMSIDLVKLANAHDEDADIQVSSYGSGQAFTPDSAYLKPVAATFGGIGRIGETPWSSMTLWIAMIDGDLHALCPLLPPRFQSYPGFINSLSTILDVKTRETQSTTSPSSRQATNAQQQSLWIQHLEGQEPVRVTMSASSTQRQVYKRPPFPRPEPMLQGPFDLVVDDTDIADLFIRNISVADDSFELDSGQVVCDDDENLLPLSVSIFCVLATNNTLHLLLDLDGVEPMWLPTRTPSPPTPKTLTLELAPDIVTPHTLLPLAIVPLDRKGKFTELVNDASAMITPILGLPMPFCHKLQRINVSLEPIAERLLNELDDPAEEGADIRASMAFSANIQPESIIKFDLTQQTLPGDTMACTVILEPELGLFVLASSHGHPYAVTLDTRYQQDLAASTRAEPMTRFEIPEQKIPKQPARQAYEPDDRFYSNSQVPAVLSQLYAKPAISFQENVRLNPETLEILLACHKIFGLESGNLRQAVSKLHRAMKLLEGQFNAQLDKIREAARVIDGITGQDEEDYEDSQFEELGTEKLQARLDHVNQRQQELFARYKNIQDKFSLLNDKKVSDQEIRFREEVDDLDRALYDPRDAGDEKDEEDDHDDADDDEPIEIGHLAARVQEVNQLYDEVISATASITETDSVGSSKLLASQSSLAASTTRSLGHTRRPSVPIGIRGVRIKKIFSNLELQTAMVDGTAERLQRQNAMVDGALERLKRLSLTSK